MEEDEQEGYAFGAPRRSTAWIKTSADSWKRIVERGSSRTHSSCSFPLNP